MKITLIAPKNVYQTVEIQQEALDRGHEVKILPLHTMNISNLESNDFNDQLIESDLIYIRTGLDNITKSFLTDLVKRSGKKLINASTYNNPSFVNKIFQIGEAARKGIKVPKSMTMIYTDFLKSNYKETPKTNRESAFEKLVDSIGLPFIAKDSLGSKGIGVEKINNLTEFNNLIENNNNDTQSLLFQECIPNTGDYRILIIGDKAIEAYKRVPKEGEFRANIATGGHGEKIENSNLKKQIMRAGLEVSKALDIEIAGIDIIQSSITQELYFLEINRSMQWRGLKTTTGCNVAKHMVDYFELQINNG